MIFQDLMLYDNPVGLNPTSSFSDNIMLCSWNMLKYLDFSTEIRRKTCVNINYLGFNFFYICDLLQIYLNILQVQTTLINFYLL